LEHDNGHRADFERTGQERRVRLTYKDFASGQRSYRETEQWTLLL
jgi:hypothetical protein